MQLNQPVISLQVETTQRDLYYNYLETLHTPVRPQQTFGPSTPMVEKIRTPNGERRAEPMVESCSSLAALDGRGAGGTVCHPSHTPGGYGHGVGVVLSQEEWETRTQRNVRNLYPSVSTCMRHIICTPLLSWKIVQIKFILQLWKQCGHTCMLVLH